MWAKFATSMTSALKVGQAGKEASVPPKDQQAPGEVLNKVFEQHPNLSMFHTNESGMVDRSPSPPPSPSVHNRKNMFKRMSRATLKDDLDAKKGNVQNDSASGGGFRPNNNDDIDLNFTSASQSSLPIQTSNQRDMPRRSSFDMLRPSPLRAETTRSVKDARVRPSLDFFRQEAFPPEDSLVPQSLSQAAGTSSETAQMPPQVPSKNEMDWANSDFPSTPAGLDKFGSKRSILRDRNTPGTGQNVRFIGRDAYKVITPDQSLSGELQGKPQPPLPQIDTPFIDRLTQAGPSDSPSTLDRSNTGSSPTAPRQPVAEIFASLFEESPAPAPFDQTQSDISATSFNHFVVEDNSNIFDTSQQLEIPSFPPPGLGFDVNMPIFDNLDSSGNDDQILAEGGLAPFSDLMTSTPNRGGQPTGKAKEHMNEGQIPMPGPSVIDETIFHSAERSPQFPAPLHERSHSFSLGQTLFYTPATSGGNVGQPAENFAHSSSSEKKGDSSPQSKTSTPPSVKSRTRAMSDTVFQTMLRSSSSSSASKPVEPEADINDDSSAGLVVYSGGAAEPDPFSAHANTYYTPQTMIPMTPPKGTARHNRKTSKEENIIISLQTQLALRTELCSQYEADLKARDELVELLSKKLDSAEKEEAKRKAALRTWKRKVQDLEKACRQLEEAVEDSRQMSMERSVMDEASSEALRMLHRQIASLEREKGDWTKREAELMEEVEALESIVKERSEDVIQLKESLWSRDQSERELKEGIIEAKEQIDMMGNISLGAIDEEELRKILMEKDQKTAEETLRFRTAEFELKQELADVKMRCEGLEVQKADYEEQLENVTQALKAREDEYAVLKNELEAQWQHTESACERADALEKEKLELEAERDELKAALEEIEHRASATEVEWNESENRRQELENELQEVWNLKDAVEKERDELEDAIQHERKQIQDLEHDMEERERRISNLEEEQHFLQEEIVRLQNNARQTNEEIQQSTEQIRDREMEAERLREEMSTLKREYQHLLNEQSRVLEDVTGQHDQTQHQMDEMVRNKAAVDLEVKTMKERVSHLNDELERLRRHNHMLQQESADKEVKIIQAGKQHAQDKEDMAGLNIALDSKQQELELLKRKLGVKGTAGSTPAPGSKAASRRDSAVFSATPLNGFVAKPSSRPPSVASDAESSSAGPRTERAGSAETNPQSISARVSALGKSGRVNVMGGTSVSAVKSISGRTSTDSSMGPPSLKPRQSMTPTPVGRVSSLTRTYSAKVGTPQSVTPVPHRRVASVEQQQTPTQKTRIARASISASPAPSSVAEVDEKENMSVASPPPPRKRTLIPVPA